MKGYFWSDKDKIIDEVLQPLLKLGLSVNKSCRYAGIPQSTVQSWINKDDSLRLKVRMWQSELSLVARRRIVEAIEDPSADNINLCVWWLKTKEADEFSEKREPEECSVTVTYRDLFIGINPAEPNGA